MGPSKLDEIQERELLFKLQVIKKFLEDNGGINFKLYNRSCPDFNEPDSNIVEYLNDVVDLINILLAE